MSGLAEGLKTHLLASAAVSALVADRIYFGNLPQRPTYPAVTVNFLPGISVNSNDGYSGLDRMRVQVDAWSSGSEQARILAAALKVALASFSGVTLEDPGAPIYDEEAKTWHVPVDIRVWDGA
jgi:hypothetical protein